MHWHVTNWTKPESLEQEPVEAEVSEGDDGGPANDPVRMYLKRLGDTPFDTRGRGRRGSQNGGRKTPGFAGCPGLAITALVELLAIKDRLLSGKLRVR